MKKLLPILFVLLPVFGFCQYIPQFSQLIKTLELVNPGYNASKVDPSATLLYRNQWTGFDGAPKTFAANINVPVNKWHTGFGVNAIGETRGLITQTNIALNANVDVKINELSYLAFGINGGVETKRIDMGRAIYFGDLPFVAEDFNSNSFYTGVGLNFFARELHLGAAFHYTQLAKSNYNSNEFYSLYLNGSYLLNLSETWSVKPSLMYRYHAGYSDLDIGFFGLYKDLFWAGVAYRINNAVIFFADVKITNFLRLGYSYDLDVRKIDYFDYGSHEISVEITLPRKTKQFERMGN